MAEGSIIPAIIAAHIAQSSTSRGVSHVTVIIHADAPDMGPYMSRAIAITQIQQTSGRPTSRTTSMVSDTLPESAHPHWSETATAHVPGIQSSDVTELLEHGATVVVLTKGVYERLRVCPETLELLSAHGVVAHVLQTEEAVRVYNRLVETDRVGGLFHSTC